MPRCRASCRARTPAPATTSFARVRAQKMTVELQTQSTSAYFNVLAPGSEDALYRGEVASEPRWSGALPVAGDYRVRVFLNRAAARQGKSASYALKISVVD